MCVLVSAKVENNDLCQGCVVHETSRVGSSFVFPLLRVVVGD